MFKYEGKLFTGILVAYEEDGSLVVEEEYKEGYLDGWVRSYYPSGQLAEEYEIHDNITVRGTYKKWDKEGNLTIGIKPEDTF